MLPAEFPFERRACRPPTDPVNSLLSFGYTLLHANVYTLLQVEGLDPRVGFFHVARGDFPALACDLTEEFRAPVVDRLVLEFLGGEEVQPRHFTQTPRGCWMLPVLRRRFLQAFESLLWRPAWKPRRGRSYNWREVIQRQIRVLAEVLMDRRAQYQPFLWDPACSS